MPTTSRQPLSARVLAIAAGSLLGLTATAIAVFLLLRNPTPALSRAALDEATERWRRAGVRDYDLDVEILGRQPGLVHLEVRAGNVTAMTRDGRTPGQRRTWEAWTVDNQLATIGDELDHAAEPVRGFGAPPGSQVVQRAAFDPQLGYPRDYQRSVLGTPLEVEWRVTNFIDRGSAPNP
ncbi:MAG TPA: DUF6174 domain-containing protein [Pirellulales bacterium]|jgi:hypothetical protein|nr:DUF6174 domain-containing protein [Pirellulales bacterium]